MPHQLFPTVVTIALHILLVHEGTSTLNLLIWLKGPLPSLLDISIVPECRASSSSKLLSVHLYWSLHFLIHYLSSIRPHHSHFLHHLLKVSFFPLNYFHFYPYKTKVLQHMKKVFQITYCKTATFQVDLCTKEPNKDKACKSRSFECKASCFQHRLYVKDGHGKCRLIWKPQPEHFWVSPSVGTGKL